MTVDHNLDPRGVAPPAARNVYEAPIDGPVIVPAAGTQERIVQSGAGIERRELRVTDASGAEHHEAIVDDVAGEQWFSLVKASQVIWLVIGVIEALIGLRVLLKLVAANPNNDFAHFVYNSAGLFLAPFFGLTGTPAAGGMVLEIPSLIAMLVYAFLGWGIVRVLWLLLDRPMTRRVSTYDRY